MSEKPILMIASERTPEGYWQDIWRHRELLFFLAWRDLLVRYRQTVVGVSWTLLRPLLMILAFTFLFGQLANLPSSGLPYSLIVMSGMLPWQFFSTSLSDSSNSLVGNAHLVSKVYFPRLIVVLSTMLVSLVDHVVTLVLLVALLLWHGYAPDWRIALLPLAIMFTAISSFGFGVWASALNVRYRDFRHLIPFLLQIGLFLSPVAYSADLIPEKWRPLYSLNPLAGIIDGFRWCVLGEQYGLYWPSVVISMLFSLAVAILGVRYFRQAESAFADVI